MRNSPNRLYNLSLEWYGQASTPEQKDETYNQITAAIGALEILYDLASRRRGAIEKPTKAVYDTPAWEYHLAHDNGRLEELNWLTRLLDPLFKKD